MYRFLPYIDVILGNTLVLLLLAVVSVCFTLSGSNLVLLLLIWLGWTWGIFICDDVSTIARKPPALKLSGLETGRCRYVPPYARTSHLWHVAILWAVLVAAVCVFIPLSGSCLVGFQSHIQQQQCCTWKIPTLVVLDHPNPRDTVSLDCGINFRPYCSISDYGPIDGPHPNDSDENMLDINCLDNASIRRRLIISNQKL